MKRNFLHLALLLASTLTFAQDKVSDLDQLAQLMSGTFSSEYQSQQDSDFFSINLEMHPIWKSETTHEVKWLYVEQAVSAMKKRPYRQRVYRLSKGDDGIFESKVYELPQPKKFIQAWQTPELFDNINPDSLVERQGCSVFLKKIDDQIYSGSTDGDKCKSTLRGASYATSKVDVSPAGITSWDQGWNDQNEQVWGAVKSGYIFDRLESSMSIEEEVFYHVCQRSFYDSNGDGHGDLKGFTEKLDYLKELGVTSVLMLPLYKSIYYHNYFPDDFKAIDEEFGTEEDYLNMIKSMHEKDLKFYMDMEIQYVTSEHPWFKESLRNPDSEYSEYVIYNGENNTKPESIIFNLTELEGYDGKKLGVATIDLYNEDVRNYMHDLFKYWIDPNKDGNFEDGVDGFRIDHMMDDLDWKGIQTGMFEKFWAPLFKELKSINPNIKIIAEQADWKDVGTDFFEKGSVDLTFGFSVRDALTTFEKSKIVDQSEATFEGTPDGRHQLIFLENHDIDRYASVVEGNDAKMRFGAAYSILSKGVPLIYYGQELGMTGIGGHGKYGSTDANDIPRREAFEWYETVKGKGMALWYKDSGQWWDETNLKDYDGISYAEQSGEVPSLFNLYKELLDLRKSSTAFTKGRQAFVENKNADLLSVCRWDGQEAYLIIFNTSDQKTSMEVNVMGLPFKFEKVQAEMIMAQGAIQKEEGEKPELEGYGFSVLKIDYR